MARVTGVEEREVELVKVIPTRPHAEHADKLGRSKGWGSKVTGESNMTYFHHYEQECDKRGCQRGELWVYGCSGDVDHHG